MHFIAAIRWFAVLFSCVLCLAFDQRAENSVYWC